LWVFFGICKWLYIDNFVDEVTVRDKESYRQLKEIVKVTQNIQIRIDPVAEMNVYKYIEDTQDDNSVTLIFTEYFNSTYFDKKHHHKWDLLFESFCFQINAVIDNKMIPKLVFFQKDTESNLANKFLNIFGNKIVIEYPAEYKEAIKTLNKSKAIISFRLHGNILAYALKKPFLPIIYHHKTAGFLEHIDYPFLNLVLEVGDGQNWKDVTIIKEEWYQKTNLFIKELKNEL